MKNRWYIFIIIAYVTFMCGFFDFNNYFLQSFSKLLLSLITSIVLFVICVVLFIDFSSLAKVIYNKICGWENSIVVLFPFVLYNYSNNVKFCVTFDITLLFNTFYPYNMICDKNKEDTSIRDRVVKYEKETLFIERILCAGIYVVLFLLGKYFWAISLMFLSLSLKDIRSANNDLITGSIYRIENISSFDVSTVIVKQLCLYNYFDCPIYTEYVEQLCENISNNSYSVGSVEVIMLDLLTSGTGFFDKKYWDEISSIVIDDFDFENGFTNPISNSLWALYRMIFVYAIIRNDHPLKTKIINKIKIIKNNCVGAGSNIMIQYLNEFMNRHAPKEVMHNLRKYIQLDKIYRKSPTGALAISNIINHLSEVSENE